MSVMIALIESRTPALGVKRTSIFLMDFVSLFVLPCRQSFMENAISLSSQNYLHLSIPN